jgi:hypothetical protein
MSQDKLILIAIVTAILIFFYFQFSTRLEKIAKILIPNASRIKLCGIFFVIWNVTFQLIRKLIKMNVMSRLKS